MNMPLFKVWNAKKEVKKAIEVIATNFNTLSKWSVILIHSQSGFKQTL